MGGAALGRLGLCGLLAAPERPVPKPLPRATGKPWTRAPSLAQSQRNPCFRLRPGLLAPPPTPAAQPRPRLRPQLLPHRPGPAPSPSAQARPLAPDLRPRLLFRGSCWPSPDAPT